MTACGGNQNVIDKGGAETSTPSEEVTDSIAGSTDDVAQEGTSDTENNTESNTEGSTDETETDESDPSVELPKVEF